MAMDYETRLESLRWAIHGIKAPLSCAGTCTPDKPLTLIFRDNTRFTVARGESAHKQVELLRPLIDRCKPAAFGDKRQTRYDSRVRDALQLKADKDGLSVQHFDPQTAGILDTIRREMLPHDSAPISAELYGLNVYQSGGHFAPHKDTPRGEDMFGTLVVCLPSLFRRGELTLSHRGVVQHFDWGSAIAKQRDDNQLHWAAFFGDVDHQITEVWSGARVTLTYLLRRDGTTDEPTRAVEDDDLSPTILEAWRELLADRKFLPQGGVVGYPCCHLYHQDARFQVKQKPLSRHSANMLKGRDQLVAATALQAGMNVSFTPYLFETCIDETWQLERFPTQKEKSRMKRQMELSDLESALPLDGQSSEKVGDFGVTWLEPPPTSRSQSVEDSTAETGSELPTAGRLHSCEYCEWGYFGNEASDVDFYIYAALHVQVPELGEGPRATTKLPKVANKKNTAKGSAKKSVKKESAKQQPKVKKRSQAQKKTQAKNKRPTGPRKTKK